MRFLREKKVMKKSVQAYVKAMDMSVAIPDMPFENTLFGSLNVTGTVRAAAAATLYHILVVHYVLRQVITATTCIM
jgi:hypothetical protein